MSEIQVTEKSASHSLKVLEIHRMTNSPQQSCQSSLRQLKKGSYFSSHKNSGMLEKSNNSATDVQL